MTAVAIAPRHSCHFRAVLATPAYTGGDERRRSQARAVREHRSPASSRARVAWQRGCLGRTQFARERTGRDRIPPARVAHLGGQPHSARSLDQGRGPSAGLLGSGAVSRCPCRRSSISTSPWRLIARTALADTCWPPRWPFQRKAAQSLDLRRFRQDTERRGHERVRARSLAYHRAVARRLRKPMVEEARHVLFRWRAQGRIDERYAERWEQLLNQPLREIRRALVDEERITTISARTRRSPDFSASPSAGESCER